MLPERDRVDALVTIDFTHTLATARDLSMKMLGLHAVADVLHCRYGLSVVALALGVAAAHVAQEVKDEHKQSEGDPHVKGRIRQLRMQRAKQRMMQKVPDATVVW